MNKSDYSNILDVLKENKKFLMDLDMTEAIRSAMTVKNMKKRLIYSPLTVKTMKAVERLEMIMKEE